MTPSASGCVRVGLGHDRAQHRVGLKIEDENRTLPAAVADEAASHSRDEGHAVGTLLARNVRDDFARISIDHHRVGGSWNIEPVIVRIEGHVIPGASTCDGKGLHDRPTALGKCKRNK